MEKHSHKDIESLVWLITDADAVVVGAGSGLSSAAGFNHYHWAPALETHLGEFKDYYHLKGRSLYLQGDLADILKELWTQLEKEK